MQHITHFYTLDFRAEGLLLNIKNKIIIPVFILFLTSLLILNIITPDKDFSESENRVLSQLPSFSFDKLMTGKYTKDIEDYITDQFTFRDYWVSLKSDMERLLLKTQNNGIYFGKDEYLLEDYEEPSEQIDKNISNINKFKNKLPDVFTSVVLVPTSVKIYEDKLPLFASPDNELASINKTKNNLNENINFIDVYEALNSKKDEHIYFRTDHHWTMRGAYYAYETLANSLNITPYSKEDFNSEIVSKSFYGTLYSKSNDRSVSPDSIEIFKPKFDIDYTISYVDTETKSNSLYEYSHLSKKDKYSLFLDGNHSLINIKTSVNNGKKLVIFKDSYSHCFIPFLANHYEEIHVIDLRYYKLNIYDYIEENNIDEALFLYNILTFSEDKNLRF